MNWRTIEMKMVGQVCEEEKNIIFDLYEKRNALVNLKKIIDEKDFLYLKLMKELEHTRQEESKWWEEKAVKYNWESRQGCVWRINFDNNKVFLDSGRNS